MTDEVLGWDDTSNNRFIASGKGSLICNPITAYRTAAKDNPDVYKNLEIAEAARSGRPERATRRPHHVVRHLQLLQGAGSRQGVPLRDEQGGAARDGGLDGIQPSVPEGVPARSPCRSSETSRSSRSSRTSPTDVKFIGYPGPMTKTATTMYAKFIVPTMFAEVCQG